MGVTAVILFAMHGAIYLVLKTEGELQSTLRGWVPSLIDVFGVPLVLSCTASEILNGRLRDECLNVELFWLVEDARARLEKWRVDHNFHHPHSSLANLPPAAFANEPRQKKPTTNRELLTVENSS